MNILKHYFKVALRSLAKYKLQSAISIFSLAIGIITLTVIYSYLSTYWRLPVLFHEPYSGRSYSVTFDSIQPDNSKKHIWPNSDIIRRIKANGGMSCIEQGPMATNGTQQGCEMEYVQGNLKRKYMMDYTLLDPCYPHYIGIRSAITGKKVRILKKNEAVIGKRQAKKIFGDCNPVGASVLLSDYKQSVRLTLVDVIDDFSVEERLSSKSLLVCGGPLEEVFNEGYYAAWLEFVLKENLTTDHLKRDINSRLKPIGVQVKDIKKATDVYDVKTLFFAQAVTYLIASLILLASMAGFLRMLTQLLWMRRREIALRMVNGASKNQILTQFMTEVAIVIGLAVLVACLMGVWVNYFLTSNPLLAEFANKEIKDVLGGCVVLGCVMLIVCAIPVGMVVRRVCKNEQGLSASMSKSRTHLFRNFMIGLQIAISLFFLCSTLDFSSFVRQMAEYQHVPENEQPYRESLHINASSAENPENLKAHLAKIPEVKMCIPCDDGYHQIKELSEDSLFLSRRARQADYFKMYEIGDTTWIHYMGIKVAWMPNNSKDKCILVSEPFYKKIQKRGIAQNGVLTIYDDSYLIAGTFSYVPYMPSRDIEAESVIVIDPKMEYGTTYYLLVAKSGQYKEMFRKVTQTILQQEPTIVNQMVSNYRDTLVRGITVFETIKTVTWILCFISIVICVMSIYSSITLDTRTRRKEVAVRKINGASAKDIVQLFGRKYAFLTLLALLVAVPSALLLSKFLVFLVRDASIELVSPILPIGLGAIMIVLLIMVIIGWQIKGIMRIDPSEVLAKE